MLAHGSPTTDTGKPMVGNPSASPDVTRSGLGAAKPRPGQMYQSPQEAQATPFSPHSSSTGTYAGTPAANGVDYAQLGPGPFKRSNSDSVARVHDSPNQPSLRQQRHASFGVVDSKPAEFGRPSLQSVGSYGMMPSGAAGQGYHHGAQSSPQSFVSQQNFTPFTLPPPGFATAAATTSAATRDSEPSYATSMSVDYTASEPAPQQSGPDMMLLDQMTAPNTMPVFGGEGYSRSPFAIPEDFVAYLFNQPLEGASPMGQMGQQGYAK